MTPPLPSSTRFPYTTLFRSAFEDVCDTEGDADNDAWGDQRTPVVMRSRNKIAQHGFGGFEVRDDAVFHRPNRGDRCGGTAEHFFGFAAHCKDTTALA